MKINPDKKFIIIVILVVLAVIFYWFEVRPSQIRSQCDLIAWNRTKEISGDTDYYDWKYLQCLHSKGLK